MVFQVITSSVCVYVCVCMCVCVYMYVYMLLLQAVSPSPEQYPCYQLTLPLLSQFALPMIRSVAHTYIHVLCILALTYLLAYTA